MAKTTLRAPVRPVPVPAISLSSPSHFGNKLPLIYLITVLQWINSSTSVHRCKNELTDLGR